jgi:beta-glucan synthesis-associated protein KRE6
MVTSWNKLCFTGGYMEVAISLPGSDRVPVSLERAPTSSPTTPVPANAIVVQGFWPGAWTMGNLARAGYGATTDGVWP